MANRHADIHILLLTNSILESYCNKFKFPTKFYNILPQVEVTRTTRTPAFWGYPPPPHDYPYHWVILDPKSKEDKVKVTNLKNSPKFQIFEFWNGHYTRHTFLNCLIRCANKKWIRWVLLKIQSGHDSVHRRTDGQTDKVIPVYPPINFVEAGGITSHNLKSNTK